jgi:hypothetical protein
MKTAVSVALMVGLTGTALAGDEAKTKVAVEILGDGGTHARHFMINSEDLGFKLDEMQVGESRSIVDESGQTILVTRSEEGFSLDVDGETIELPNFQGGEHAGMQWIMDGDDSDIDVHVMSDIDVIGANEISGTMIVSPKPIDSATQQAIRSLLQSAGYGDEVEFINHDGAGPGKVMIKKMHIVSENPQT